MTENVIIDVPSWISKLYTKKLIKGTMFAEKALSLYTFIKINIFVYIFCVQTYEFNYHLCLKPDLKNYLLLRTLKNHVKIDL